MRTILIAYIAMAMLLLAGVAKAASEVVQIRLSGDSTQVQYKVPTGKVLIVEHIDFCDYWVGQADPLEVWISHSTNPSGSVWSSNLTFVNAHNYLLRPLRLPAGAAITMPYFGSVLFKTFLYGVLIDAPSQIITAPAP